MPQGNKEPRLHVRPACLFTFQFLVELTVPTHGMMVTLSTLTSVAAVILHIQPTNRIVSYRMIV